MSTNQEPSGVSSAYAVTSLHAKLQDRLTSDVNTWKAMLPFEGIVGFNGAVNLFDYVGTEFYSRGDTKYEIKFDAKLYPATDEGMKALTKELKHPINIRPHQ